MDEDFIGAVKIKDALFLGDKDSSQDLDFLLTSKITHIINVASQEVKDEWASIGIIYLSFPFQDTYNENMYRSRGEVFVQCFEFIEKTLELGESVLLHSVKGESRSACIVLAYLMQKYSWALSKSLEFLNSRKPDCKINTSFLAQLVIFESQLTKTKQVSLAKTWDQTDDPEETLLRNTYLNSRPGLFVQTDKTLKKVKKNTLKWAENLVTLKRPTSKSLKRLKNVNKLENRKNPVLKSCLKSSTKPVLVNISKSLNNLTGRPLSSTSKESLADEPITKRKARTSSVSKRENSPKAKEKKPEQKPKKKPLFFAFGAINSSTIIKKQLLRPGSARRPSPSIQKTIDSQNHKQVIKKSLIPSS